MNDTDEALRAWVGRQQTLHDTIAARPVAALAVTLDHPLDDPAEGTPLPPLWHWLSFLPLARQSEIGADGHPRRGGFLPPVPLPRRMGAGSQLEFRVPLRVGDRVARTSTVEDVSSKSGRSGQLVFVKVRHEVRVEGEDEPALREWHDIVYREAQKPGEAVRPHRPRRPSWRGAARSIRIRCCSSATRPSRSTATASTTTATTPRGSRAIRASSSTGR